MPTSLSNTQVTRFTQTAVGNLSGVLDTLSPFTLGVGTSDSKFGDAVKVYVLNNTTAPSTEYGFSTDGGDSITGVNVDINAVSKKQMVLAKSDYDSTIGINQAVIDGMVKRAYRGVVDAAYGLVTVGNFPLATNKIVTGVAESALTLAHISKAVVAAKATGTLNPDNISVVVPSTTYAALINELDARARGTISIDYKLVPCYNPAITTTYITDGTLAAVAFAFDNVPVENEEIETFVEPTTGIPLSVFVIGDSKARALTMAARAAYGVKLLRSGASAGSMYWLQTA